MLQPPANQCRLLATIDTRRTARTSQPRGDRWAGEASGTDIQLGPDGRREGAISRGSNFGLWRREEGKRKEKPPVFLYYMSHSLYILFLEFGLEFGFSMYSKGAAPNSKPNSKNRYKGKLASENLARIWRASIERENPSDAPGVRILLDRCLAACAAAPALGPRCLRLSVSLDTLTALAAQSLRLV